MDINIRQASENDVPEITSILKFAFDYPLNPPSNNKYLEDSNILTFVSEIEGNVVGTATIHVIKKINRKIELIEDIAVLRSYKIRGFDKLLLEHLVE